jgi:hypothetical protein
MYYIDPESVPAVCLDKATDWIAEPDVSDVQTAVADFEVAAATVSHIGATAFAKCRVANCRAACKIFHVLSTEGNYCATGIASEEGDTDLANCVRK